MKILITPATLEISDDQGYSLGAGANLFYNMIISLSKQEDTELFVLSKGVNITKPMPSNVKIFQLDKSKIRNSFYVHTKIFLRSIRTTEKILKEEKISVINQMYLPYEAGFSPFLKKIKKYPFILGMTELPHPRYGNKLSIPRKVIKSIGKKAIHPLFLKTIDACDAMIVVNDPAKDLYGKFISRNKISVIPYGIDIEKFKFEPIEESHDILIVSRLIKRRNHEIILEAMPSILKEFPDTKLHIVGDGPRMTELRTMAKSMGLRNSVSFYGNVTEQTLINLYKYCPIFCSLSREDGWQPCLEAMATGRPVICPDALYNTAIIDGKMGIKFLFNDMYIYAEVIKKLFGDITIAEKMGIEGRKEVERNYNWNEIGKKYIEVYRSVI